jgi:hypothetical protein
VVVEHQAAGIVHVEEVEQHDLAELGFELGAPHELVPEHEQGIPRRHVLVLGVPMEEAVQSPGLSPGVGVETALVENGLEQVESGLEIYLVQSDLPLRWKQWEHFERGGHRQSASLEVGCTDR